MTMLAEHPTTTFPAPDATTAPAPAERRGLERDGVRLLVASPGGVRHARFRDLGDHLAPGDLVVVNDSMTEARQLDADLVGRGRVVLHLAQRLEAGWVVEVRSAPDASRAVLDASDGDLVVTGGLRVTLLEPYPGGRPSSPTGEGNRLWRARVTGDVDAELDRAGRPIAYGYLDRRYPLDDYQTIFGHRHGSAEMPSAARPFTHPLVTELVTRGIQIAPITLHTGVSSQEAGEAPGAEWFEVSATTARLVEQTRYAGGRIVAAGTTVTRALESAVDPATGAVGGASGWTDRVITPGNPPYVVNGLITGWHDPQASHLLLVEAVAGPELAQRAYDAAVAEGYLWHEFGDSALLLP